MLTRDYGSANSVQGSRPRDAIDGRVLVAALCFGGCFWIAAFRLAVAAWGGR